MRYSAWDVGPRVTDNTNEFNRFLVGIKGNWGDWSYDTAYLLGRIVGELRPLGDLRGSRLLLWRR